MTLAGIFNILHIVIFVLILILLQIFHVLNSTILFQFFLLFGFHLLLLFFLLLLGLAGALQRLDERRLGIVVQVAIHPPRQPLEQLLLDAVLDLGGHQRLLLPALLALIDLAVDPDHLGLLPGQLLEPELAHADEVLVDLGQALLVAVDEVLGPVGQMLVELGHGLGVVAAQGDALPQVLGTVRALDRLEVQADLAVLLADGGVAAVGQGAGRAVAKARDAVRVAAEVAPLGLGPADRRLERAELVVDHLPYHFVVLHLGNIFICGCVCVCVRSIGSVG